MCVKNIFHKDVVQEILLTSLKEKAMFLFSCLLIRTANVFRLFMCTKRAEHLKLKDREKKNPDLLRV